MSLLIALLGVYVVGSVLSGVFFWTSLLALGLWKNSTETYINVLLTMAIWPYFLWYVFVKTDA